jgi:L,D-transpeptidase ErfK/SrfK
MTCLLVAIVWLVALSADAGQRVELTGTLFNYEVKHGDSLSSIGSRFGVGVRALAVINDIGREDVLRAGRSLAIDNRHLAVITPGSRLSINIAQRMLFLVDEKVTAYPIAVGRRDWPTPVGPFTVRSKETDPTWDVPASIQEEMRRRGDVVITRMPPSPRNPLGAHWIGLSVPSLGLHGTAAPSSIYQFASHGCIRLHPDDIAAVFAHVSVGDAGELTYQPVILAAIDGRVFLEAHPDVYGRVMDAQALVRRIAQDRGFESCIDWARATQVLASRLGIAVEVTRE